MKPTEDLISDSDETLMNEGKLISSGHYFFVI